VSGKLGAIISQVSVISANSAIFGHELHTNAEKIAAGMEDVAAQATTVATAGEEMSATSNDIAHNCQMASEGAQRASESARSGAAVVDATVGIMSRIAENVQRSAKTVESLGERSDQIGNIIGTIEDIADQTNLLALNAAIEAARAGEQGRGFAVVADEVRALAERTTRATREIGVMIKAIQGETKGAVAAMEQGVRQVETGTVEAAKSGEALREILEHVNDVAMQVSQIATAAEEQTATTSEISGSMQQITTLLQTTAQEAHESAVSTSRMNSHVEEMMTTFAKFKLNEDVQLTISKAKSAHMIFIGKIKSHLDGSARIDADKLPTHLTCAFGKWYQSKGKECCGTISQFREIDAPHAKVHELGKQAIAASNSGDKRKAQDLCAEMVASSVKLMGILDELGRNCH
jgi:methyl-accepting chemotaxis protein